MIFVISEPTPSAMSAAQIAEALSGDTQCLHINDRAPFIETREAQYPADMSELYGFYPWFINESPAWVHAEQWFGKLPYYSGIEDVTRRWVQHWWARLSGQKNLKAIVSWGASLPGIRAARWVAMKLGIRTVSVEEGLFPVVGHRTLMVDPGPRAYYEGPVPSLERWRDHTTHQRRIDAYRENWAKRRMTKNVVGKGREMVIPPEFQEDEIVCFGQVPWDAAKWAADPTGATTDQMREDAFNAGAWYKSHPLYPIYEGPMNQIPVKTSLHALWGHMRLAISLCSNTSLEAVLAGVPACVYSESHFVPEEILPRGIEAGLGYQRDQALIDKWLDYLIHVHQVCLDDHKRLVARVEGD